jgi:hypothetical protein
VNPWRASVSIVALAVIAFMEKVALDHHINGTLLRLALVAVAGIAGFSLSRILRR